MDLVADHLARLSALLDAKHAVLIELTARLAAAPPPFARLGLDRTDAAVLIAACAPALDLALARRLREVWAGDAPTVEEVIELVAVGATTEAAVVAALDPEAPLAAGGLVELAGTGALLGRTLRVDARIPGFLRGRTTLDRRLAHVACLIPRQPLASPAVAPIARALAAGGPLVVDGPPRVGKTRAVLGAAARSCLVVDVELLAEEPALLARTRREALLHDALLVLRARSWSEAWPPAFRRELVAAIHAGAVLVARDASEPWRRLQGARRVTITMPEADAQAALWRTEVGDAALDVAALVARYPLPPGDIVVAAGTARVNAELAGRAPCDDDLVRAARERIDHRMGDVAERVTTSLGWDDLVLPAEVLAQLRALVDSVRHRDRVMREWCFAATLPYGRATGALFSGPPGTGKTMVATLIGNSLGLETFRVDLSRVVSKYIGETEKNLARVFEEAARCRAVLVFDEADALFARRTEVKSANDRNANLEVNYLLQRLEAHDGIVILTTNAAGTIDPAFQRRLRFRIEFPAPDADERERLWRSMVPAGAPLAPDVDFADLAERYPLAGGDIKNALVRAAFLAAGEGLPALDRGVLDRGAALEWMELGRLPRAARETTASTSAEPEPVAPPAAPAPEASPALPGEPAMLAVLLAAAEPGDTIEAAFRRKERLLGELIAQLSPGDADVLGVRLAGGAADDALVAAFGRLSPERQARLIAFLDDAPRRQVFRPAAGSRA